MRSFRIVIVWSFTAFVLVMGPSLLAQAAAAVTGAPMPTAAADEWGTAFLWSIVSSWGIRWWREHPKLSGFSEATALKLQRLISLAVGFLGGLGITFVFDKDAGTLVIGGLFATAVLHAARQFFLQEFVYQSAIKRPTPTP